MRWVAKSSSNTRQPAASIHRVRLTTGPIGMRHWARTNRAASSAAVNSGSNAGTCCSLLIATSSKRNDACTRNRFNRASS
ncbi:Uncharacterised protein [Mycobacterium tuberculosis]|uniref:Uncharacterized protein n=1 Tax=Mycobacterium tuberculosis TaxID=1773 RepID=A0A655JR78_MYCTX|nr:Uncharacterised protein [Mycobacterium tuberculosis]COX44198.1 Uncharacterised protein [Mycobacterium tuberculosis]COY47774.1 Uncharacterised protein [Mycobacterium tuberculosis]